MKFSRIVLPPNPHRPPLLRRRISPIDIVEFGRTPRRRQEVETRRCEDGCDTQLKAKSEPGTRE